MKNKVGYTRHIIPEVLQSSVSTVETDIGLRRREVKSRNLVYVNVHFDAWCNERMKVESSRKAGGSLSNLISFYEYQQL